MRGVFAVGMAVVWIGCGPGQLGETEAVLDARWSSTELARWAVEGVGRARSAPEDLAHSAVSLALLATYVTGSTDVRTHGTLYAPARPGDRWTYSASPWERLVYVAADGARVEVTFARLQGDASSEDAFLAGEHEVRFTFDDGRERVAVSSRSAGALTVRSLSGALEFDGVRCSGTSTGLSETTRSRRQTTWGGHLECGTTTLRFDERLHDDLAGYTERRLHYRWQQAGRSYELRDARVETWRSDGAVIDQRAEGDLMRNTATVGALDEETIPTPGGARVGIYLYTEDGRVKVGEESVRAPE